MNAARQNDNAPIKLHPGNKVFDSFSSCVDMLKKNYKKMMKRKVVESNKDGNLRKFYPKNCVFPF